MLHHPSDPIPCPWVRYRFPRLLLLLPLLALGLGPAEADIPTHATYNAGADVLSIDFSVTNRFAAIGTGGVASPDLRIFNWRTNAVHLTNTVSLGNRQIESVRWHPTQYWLAAGTKSLNAGDLYLFTISPTNGQILATNHVSIGAGCTALAWHPNQNRLLVGTEKFDRELMIINFAGGTMTTAATFNVSGATGREVQRGAMAWHPNGSNFVVGLDYNNTSGERNLQVFGFNGSTITKVMDFNFSLTSVNVAGIDISDSGRLLAVGLSRSTTAPANSLRIFRMNPTNGTISQVGVIPPINRSISGVHWIHGGELLAVSLIGSSSSEDVRIYQWNDTEETLTFLDGNNLTATLGANTFRWSKILPFLGSGDNAGANQAKFYRFSIADLTLSMTGLPSVVCSGSNLVLSLTVTNRGPDPAPNVTVRSVLPTNLLTFVSASTNGSVAYVNDEVIFNLGTMASGSVFSVTITTLVDVAAMGSVTNTAFVTSSIPDSIIANNSMTITNLFDVDCDGIPDVTDNCPFDFNPDQLDSDDDGVGDVCDNCPFTFNPDQTDSIGDGIGDVCRPVDLSLSKVGSPSVTQAMNNITYTLAVTNAGPGSAEGVEIIDTFPQDLSYVTSSVPASLFANQVTIPLGTMPSGTVSTVTLTFLLDNPGFDPFTNVAEVSTSTTETNLANNVAFAVGAVDTDGDGIADYTDNCPTVPNSDQADRDGDGVGDFCDPDVDGDFLPNDWEDLYGFNPLDETVANHETCLDTDVDGYTNLDEFIAWTSPLDSNSFFRVSSIQPDGSVELRVASTTGRYYHVYVLTDLVSQAWTPWLTNKPGQLVETILIDTNPGVGRFYRIGVTLQDWWPLPQGICD